MSLFDRFRITRKGPTLRHFTVMIMLFGLLLFRNALPTYLASSIFLAALMVSVWLERGKTPASFVFATVLLVVGAVIIFVDMVVYTFDYTLFRRPFGYFLSAVIMVLLMYCGLSVLRSLLSSEKVTANEIVGTVNLYLIVGFIWAYIYSLLELHYPGSFRLAVSGEALDLEFVYFSFVTLTTLGYGDIVPLSPSAKMIVVIEAIIGQLYLALVIAYVMSVFFAQKQPGNNSED